MRDARLSTFGTAGRGGAVMALLFASASCGEPESVDLRLRQGPLTEICGADKYTGPQGVDVSTYQPNFDWAARAAAGERFGYARVSNGTQIIDDQFDRNWAEMPNHGIYRGVYQYFRPGQDAVAQANLVVDKVGRLGRGDMPAMIDVETNDDQPAATVAAKVRQWIDIVEAGTGKKPAIYTGAYFWQDFVGDDSFGEYPLWIANYGANCPLVPDGWSTWTIWQYCDGNTAYCTNGLGFDRDVFNGTDAQLDEFVNGASLAAEVVGVSGPITLNAGETTSVFVEVKNTGASTWDPSVHLGTASPRDRDSTFADESWVSPRRVAAVSGDVASDQSYRFEFNLRAPAMVGEYEEVFGLVKDGTAWFADDGGPPEDAIRIALTVSEVDLSPDTDAGPNGVPDAGGQMSDLDVGGPQSRDPLLPATVGPSPGVEGGCAHIAGETADVTLLLLAAVAFLARRRD